MRKLLMLLLALLLCIPAAAELPPSVTAEGWRHVGYTPSGVTFLVPDDTQFIEPTAAEREAGILLVGWNADYTVQLRRFEPEDMTVKAFRAMLNFTPGAQVETREVNGVEVVCYRNGSPTGVSELYGIALTGTDGCMYKISIFTGVAEDCSDDALVWEIASAMADSVSIVDYSGWPLSE